MAQSTVIGRFVDADKESTKMLPPIEGYETMPLVSLKEAVASIETPIHNLKSMVWTAERNSENPSDGLTSNESASIHLYTVEWPEGYDSFYTLLNQKLRSEKRNELRSWYSYLKLFFTALHKLPSIKTVVWRGMLGDVSHLYRKDFIWWGVSSCIDTIEVIEKFIGRSGVRTLFMIECINGKSIQSHSFYKDVNEIILMPGTYLRVIGKVNASTSDLNIIHLKEETPPWQLVASPVTSLDLRAMTTSKAQAIGFAVGGAKDANNFRENIENNYLPIITDLSYEGLFYDYFFDTGDQREETDKNQLFCPSYSMAFTTNPLQNNEEQQVSEYYMTVGLNSNLNEDTFKRNPMNLLVCIDRSGSMGSAFNHYHYDNRQTRRDENENTQYDNRSKMLITLEVVSKVVDHLKPNDRLAVMTFDTGTSVIQTMKVLKEINLEDLKNEISKIDATGGTNMSAAINCCASLFDTDQVMNDKEYDNRILFLTDAQPNEGNLGATHFYSRIEQLAKHRIYTTFIGVGIDLNTELISSITKHRGANYFSVHDSKKILQLLDKDFDFILTPLVFNVKMKFESDLFDIEHVYGSPEWDETKQNELININTLFPSRTDDEHGTRGGIVLLKLKTNKSTTDKVNTTAYLSVTYEDRLGNTFEEKQLIYILVNNEIYYGNSGIRKAILLVNYVTLLKKWINDERERKYNQRKTMFNLDEKNIEKLSEWERQSTKLSVSDHYRKQFQTFLVYLQSEMAILKDKDLEQEIKLLKKLIECHG